MTMEGFTPGNLVRARGREWIVVGRADTETVRVRPLTGSEDDQTLICLPLETEPVVAASFPPPLPHQTASHGAALLLRDALLLSLRRGAGPFRSFGHISVEPRAYQLVPLLMALKLDPVRLLVADDVGIGKTIEAGLIARELLDRGDIERIAVLCPPHLVEQWVGELDARFHIRAAAVTAASAVRLERGLPPSESIFTAHPYTVVSLDYIKNEKRRSEFLRACPEFVIVDEAHTCAATGVARHQRYELLKGLSGSQERHVVMLTATPHSGDEVAFYRLLGLLDPVFDRLNEAQGETRDRIRGKLAAHFVQRRRPDIAEWQEQQLFPRRETTELTYKLTGQWQQFFDRVLDYCASIIERAGEDQRRQRLNFWGTLALMRCVSSSPAAAVQALRTRTANNDAAEEEETLEERLFDGSADALLEDDVEPAIAVGDKALVALIANAESLAGQKDDPKLNVLINHLSALVADGFNPVVFCRYIATAHYLHKHFAGRFAGVTIDVITGETTSDGREEQVVLLGEAERRLLIATDCLSEGVNLQDHFDAVVHYDLSWNPTRHEQREGRVDRFGQPRSTVRASLLYGQNNPVDGAVLQVILRKAESIRRELGVAVPLPDDGHRLTQALMRAVLLRAGSDRRQGELDLNFEDTAEGRRLDTVWQDAAEKAKRNRTVFAQRRLRPDEVLPELKRTLAAIGGSQDVKRLTDCALARLGAGLEPMHSGYKAHLGALPDDVRERLFSEGLEGTLRVDFVYPPAKRCRTILRGHPLISILGDTLLERTLAGPGGANGGADPAILGRCGCWITPIVAARATVALLRLRHQLTNQTARRTNTLLVEEATAIAWGGKSAGEKLEGADALALLAAPPSGDPPSQVREREVIKALAVVEQRGGDLEEFAERRAQGLLADHRRVREAAQARGTYTVRALLPPDVIGVFVLLPPLE